MGCVLGLKRRGEGRGGGAGPRGGNALKGKFHGVMMQTTPSGSFTT